MVHVMQSESRRRDHASRFQRSLRTAASSSHSDASHASSAHSSLLLERMCATLVASTVPGKKGDALAGAEGQGTFEGKLRRASKSWDHLPRAHWCEDGDEDDDEEALALSLADLLPRACREALDRNCCEEDLLQSLPPPLGEGDALTPTTLKSILRAPSADPLLPAHDKRVSPQEGKAMLPPPPSSKNVRISPETQRSVYSPDHYVQHQPASQPPAAGGHGAVVCLVGTKEYDGDTQERHREERQVARLSPGDARTDIDGGGASSSHHVDHHRACIDGILLGALQGEAHAEVTEMRWTETVPPFREGIYSGFVDRTLRPHGRGRWRARDAGGDGRLCGWFYQGSYIPYDYIDRMYSVPDEPSTKAMVDSNDAASSFPPLPFQVEARERTGHKERPTAHARPKRKQPKTEPKPEQPKPKQEGPYALGDPLRSPKDVFGAAALIGDTLVHMIAELREEDGAFVKRSDGRYTYATVLKRWRDPKYDEETLVFAVDAGGCKKSVPRRWWRDCLRLPREAATISPRSVKEPVGRRVRRGDDGARRPSAMGAKFDKRSVPARRRSIESASSHSISLKFRIGLRQPRRKSEGDGGVSSVEDSAH